MEWRRKKSEINEDEIKCVEKHFNVNFPNDFIEIVSNFNGARPSKRCLKIENTEFVFYSLISLSKNDKYNIFETYDWIKDRLKNGLIPIAEDSFGNYYCYDKNDNMKILLWNHENDDEIFISNSLTALLSNLKTL